jgi:hypothetical protein
MQQQRQQQRRPPVQAVRQPTLHWMAQQSSWRQEALLLPLPLLLLLAQPHKVLNLQALLAPQAGSRQHSQLHPQQQQQQRGLVQQHLGHHP